MVLLQVIITKAQTRVVFTIQVFMFLIIKLIILYFIIEIQI